MSAEEIKQPDPDRAGAREPGQPERPDRAGTETALRRRGTGMGLAAVLAAVGCVFLLGGLALRWGRPEAARPAPELTVLPTATPTPAPDRPSPTPTAAPTPEPPPTPAPYDFSASVPESEAAEEDYFDDAVFLGDSRTDGLRLFSGIQGGHFICHKGVTVFDVENDRRKVIDLDGEKVSFLEALGAEEYKKVYIMLGINELGYNNDQGFKKAYGALIDRIEELQPEAVIYIQALVPVNEEKCKANNQPYYIKNEKIETYTALLKKLAEEKHVAYVDVTEGLVDEDGLLPAELTADGIHFSRKGYVQWLDYLKVHTVDEESYWATRAAAKAEEEPGETQQPEGSGEK